MYRFTPTFAIVSRTRRPFSSISGNTREAYSHNFSPTRIQDDPSICDAHSTSLDHSGYLMAEETCFDSGEQEESDILGCVTTNNDELSVRLDDQNEKDHQHEAAGENLPEAHVRVHIPDLQNETSLNDGNNNSNNNNDSSNCSSRRYTSASGEDYSGDFRAYNTRYQPGEDTSILANELPEPEDSITSASSRMYALYSARNSQNQSLTFHHSTYPTRNYNYFNSSGNSGRGLRSEALGSQFVNLTEDVRVEWSYSRRDFRGGAGVLGDSIHPHRAQNGAIVAPSYQQIEGVGYERGREWTGRPLLEGSAKTKLFAICMCSTSAAFLILVFMTLFKVYNMLILILFLISVGIAGYTFLMYAVKNSRRPCHYCCFPPIHTPTPPVMREDFGAQASDTFLTAETSSSVAKGHIPDSPPPYESPPDYNSLPPEILMDARGLEDLCQQQSSQREPPSSSSRKSSTSSQSAPPPSFIQLSPNCTPTSTPPSGSEETGPAQITSVSDESSRMAASPSENSDDMWKLQASLRGNSSRDHLERDQKDCLEQRVEDADLQNTLDAVSDISNKTCFEKYVKLDHKMFIPFNNNSLCDFPISLSRRDKDVDDLDASEFVERLKLDSVDQLRLPQKSNRRLKFSTKSPSVEPIHSSLGTGSLAVPLIPLPVKTSNQFPDRYSLQNFIESRGYPIDHNTLNAFLYSNLNTVEQAESLLKSKTNSDTTEHFEQLLDDILESESTNTLNIIVGCSDDMDCLESNIDFSDDSMLLDKRLVDMSCNRIGNRATTRLSYPEDGTDSVLQILSSNSTKNISNSPNTSSAFHSAKSKVPQTSSSSSVCSTEIGKTSSSCPSQLPQDSTPASLVICSSHNDEENNKGIDVVDGIEQPGCRSSEQPNVPAAQPPTSDQHSTTVPFDDLVDVVIK